MTSSDQLTTLLEAATSGDVDILSSVIDEGFDVGNTDMNCAGLLQIAYTHGHNDFVRKLLEAGLNVDSIVIEDLPRTYKWHTLCLPDVLWFKVYRESFKAHSKHYRTAIEASFRNDYRAITKCLRQDQSCWKPRGNSGGRYNAVYSTLLFLLIHNSDCPSELLQMLVDKGADVNTTFHGFRIFDYAVLCGNGNGLNILLKRDCSVDENGSDSFSIFRHAIIFSKVDCLDLLLSYCDLTRSMVWNGNGAKLLTLAVRHDQDRCVDLLLKKYGAYVDVEKTDHDELNNSLLIMACENGNVTNLDLLLKYGAKVNECNHMGETPLIYAAVFGFTSCLEKLISHGADLNVVDCEHQTALMHALQRQHKDCVRSLLSAGADTSIVNHKCETALIHAVSQHDKDCLELMLSSVQQQFCKDKSFRLNNFHRDAFALALRQFDVESLLMLLMYNVFSWKWLDSFRLEEIRTEILARVLVAANISPGHFEMSNANNTTKCPKTLFQSALALQDIWTAYYLVANLYLDEYDFKHLRRENNFIQNLHCHNDNTNNNNTNNHVQSLLGTLVSQPVPLQVLCILNLSALVLKLGNCGKTNRDESVNWLPIPDKFKRILNFQGPFSNVCVDQWKALGTQMCQRCGNGNNNSLMSASLRPSNFDLDQCKCKEGCCGDNDRGFRLRYNLLCNRMQQARMDIT